MNTKIETVSKINFFGDMIGSPVFILINTNYTVGTVASMVKDIIMGQGISQSVWVESLANGAPSLVDRIERDIFYPDVVVIDDWKFISDYDYIKNIEWFTTISMRMVDSKIEGFDKFDYIVDNRGTYEMLEAVLTSIVDNIFKH